MCDSLCCNHSVVSAMHCRGMGYGTTCVLDNVADSIAAHKAYGQTLSKQSNGMQLSAATAGSR